MAYHNPAFQASDVETNSDNDSDNGETTTSMDTDVTDEELSSVEEVSDSDEEDLNLTVPVPNQHQSQNSNRSPMVQEDPSQVHPLSEKFRCPVCLISFENLTTLAITCGHVLCETCVDTLAMFGRYNCPVCKRRFRRSHSKTIYF